MLQQTFFLCDLLIFFKFKALHFRINFVLEVLEVPEVYFFPGMLLHNQFVKSRAEKGMSYLNRLRKL